MFLFRNDRLDHEKLGLSPSFKPVVLISAKDLYNKVLTLVDLHWIQSQETAGVSHLIDDSRES